MENLRQLLSQKDFVMSAEVFPPKKNGMLEGITRALRGLSAIKPDFVSITYGASGTGGDKTADVASIAIDAFDMEAVAHITAVNLTVQKLEEIIQTFKRKNIKNIMVLRGDVTPESRFYDFKHANELAYYIKKHYPEFFLLGACYPEGHSAAKSLDDDLVYVKKKLDSGIEHLISQLFYDNSTFYEMREKMAAHGITARVSAGIMPITAMSQIERTVTMCGVRLPTEFTKMIANNTEETVKTAGIRYAIEQIEDLKKNGADAVHIYTMNKADVAESIFRHFGRI